VTPAPEGEPSAGPAKLWGIPVAKLLDRAALGGIALGFVLVFQPWGGTLRSGFFVTFLATVLHIVTSHMEIPE
jgi:hypothetical protein